MVCKVKILPTAWEDIKRIQDWYLVQFGVETALKVSNQIMDAIERLEEPTIHGSIAPDAWLNERGYKMVICGQCVAFYREIESIVYVYHIADTQTDYTKLFY